jgi:hypothetical protein
MSYSSKTQQRLDKQIMRIAERSDILRFLDPKNKFEELRKFVEAKGNYNPQFIYDDKHIPLLDEVLQYIDNLKSKTLKLRDKNALQGLMIEKCEELECKFRLLQAYYKQDLDAIANLNKQLFWPIRKIGKIDSQIYSDLDVHYKIDYKELLLPIWVHNSEQLDKEQVKQLIQHHLHTIWLSNYHIKFGEHGTTNMQVSIGPKPVVYINKKISYNSWDICVSILHEVYGHLLRYHRWIQSGYHILQGWTAYYLTTEEGIAVFQAARVEGFVIVWKRLMESYLHLSKAWEYDRIQLTQYYQNLGWKNLTSIFWTILRVKRGIVDTSIIHPGTIFYKDKVYSDWYFELVNYLSWKTIEAKDQFAFDKLLFEGRMKLEDSERITCILGV